MQISPAVRCSTAALLALLLPLSLFPATARAQAAIPKTEPAAATEPATIPAPASIDSPLGEPQPSPARHTGFVEYVSNRIAPYEPMYIVAGTERPNAKFQISFRYQILNTDGPIVKAVPPLAGLNVGYSQTSFWDLEGESKPFFDNSYRPELMLLYDDVVAPERLRVFEHIGLQAGVQHESNGDDGDDSRSTNFVYIRPILTLGDRDHDGLFVTVAPRIHAYFGLMSNNPDLDEYRGFGDLRLIVGRGAGLQFAFTGRVGSGWKNGSVQMDVTYPLRKLLGGNVDLYLNAQMFNGFGESLILYNESDTTFRLGVALVR